MNKPIKSAAIFILMTSLMAMGQPLVNDLQWEAAFSLPSSEGRLPHLGLAGPVVGVSDGALLIGGGANFPDKLPWEGGMKKYHHAMYVYECTASASQPSVRCLEMPFSIAYAASCSTAKGLAIAGGEHEGGLSEKVYLLIWHALDQKMEVSALPALPFAVTNAALTSIDNRLYLAGGETVDGVSDQLLALNLSELEKGWIQQTKLPYAVSHTNLVAKDGGLFLIGGRKRNSEGLSDFYRSVWRLDLENDIWEERASLPEALSAAAALAYGKDAIWMFSGDNGLTFRKVEELLISLKKARDPESIAHLNQQRTALQTAHPGFSKQVWCYRLAADTWEAKQAIPYEAPVTTTAVVWGDKVILPSGEVRAGIRSPRIWVGKPMTTK